MWMISYVVDIALSVTHLGKVIRVTFDLVLGILNFAFKYGPDRIEQKQNVSIYIKEHPIWTLYDTYQTYRVRPVVNEPFK